MPDVAIGDVIFANDQPLRLIAGPCQLESRDHALMMAEALKTITDKLGIGFVFKASFDKANRTSADSPRGLGLGRSIDVFQEIKSLGIPTTTDIHDPRQVWTPGMQDCIDLYQVPALLCRQTDLLQALALTDKPINVKKGQFMAPHDMQNVVDKLNGYGNSQVLITERGTTFGYNNLVVDFRGIPTMGKSGVPVIFDATHSIQSPGGLGTSSGGQRTSAPVLAKAGVATGIAGIFIETHQDPDNAPSDGPCMTHLKDMPDLLKRLMEIDQVVKQ